MLLHGSHGCWAHWVRNIAALESNRRVLVPDLPGYGESAPPRDLDSPQSHASALAEGLSALLTPGQSLDIVGFSLGAFIGAHLAVSMPHLARRLIIVDAGGLDTPMPQAHLALKPLRGLSGEERSRARRHNLHTMMIHDPNRIDGTAMWIDENAGHPRSRVHHQVIPDRLLHILRQVPAQVDAIWGEHDRPHPDPAVNIAAIRTVQPAAELRIVPGAGHWSMYEGAEDFNRHLHELLETPLRGSA
nr:alpha/beta fold hydrolase [Nocardia bovistercoris]